MYCYVKKQNSKDMNFFRQTDTFTAPPLYWKCINKMTNKISLMFTVLIMMCLRHVVCCNGRHEFNNATYGVISDGDGDYFAEQHCEWLITGSIYDFINLLVFVTCLNRFQTLVSWWQLVQLSYTEIFFKFNNSSHWE